MIMMQYMNNESQCFTAISKHEKTMVICPLFSSVWIYPGETIAWVVYMASQMNRDVTVCFGLPI